MTNRLAAATSPYLRQHRDNPVHWFEWGEAAFTEARVRNVPILLSVGYSACHWCHVMAHESFEDEDVAERMNALFVNIKVDREERPDIDAIYMESVQAMTGRGGWPMTVFLTPQGEPFYGGTYFPRDSFLKLLSAIDEIWRTRQADVANNVEALMDALQRSSQLAKSETFDSQSLLSTAVDELLTHSDATWGGFGNAPKFPSTFALELLMRQFIDTDDERVRTAVITSLDAMACGGIYDHIGGGFARYSVDERWLVPHFEKMLYDQALLTRTYLHAWKLFGHDRHRQTMQETIDYVISTLTHPQGGFFSAEDADSLDASGHSHEGIFYTWTPDEVESVLGDDASDASQWWGITAEGNFEGRNIPHRMHQRGHLDRPPHIERLRQSLLTHRAQRHRPGLDDKVLTEWNAMMLATLCEAAALCDRSDWCDVAVRNGEFLVRELRTPEGRWMRSWHEDGQPRARHMALAHDHAHLVDAFTRLYELTGKATWIDHAVEVADALLTHFWDHNNGGLFTTPDDGEALVVRHKDLMDNATASSHSVTAVALLRLGAFTGRQDFSDRAHDILCLLAPITPRASSAFCHLLSAVHLHYRGITEIVVSGDRPDLVGEVRSAWRPLSILAWGEPFDTPLWRGRDDDRAYVCRNYTCSTPSSTRDQFRVALASD